MHSTCQKKTRKSREVLAWWNSKVRDDSTSNKASFKSLKWCPNGERKKIKRRGIKISILNPFKHTIIQAKKHLRYKFLQTSKLIIDPRNGMLARESAGPTDDHVSRSSPRTWSNGRKTNSIAATLLTMKEFMKVPTLNLYDWKHMITFHKCMCLECLPIRNKMCPSSDIQPGVPACEQEIRILNVVHSSSYDPRITQAGRDPRRSSPVQSPAQSRAMAGLYLDSSSQFPKLESTQPPSSTCSFSWLSSWWERNLLTSGQKHSCIMLDIMLNL